MGIDNIERGFSYVAGALAMVLALILSPHLFKNTWVTDQAKPSATNTCPANFHLVNKVCEYHHLTHPSDWLLEFLKIFVIGLAIILFAWWRKRAGVAFASLLLGLAIGAVGLPFLFLGGWLVIRALRLQKYGDATFSGSSRRARELANERRQTRRARGGGATSRSKSADSSSPSSPAPSKRYTPKQRPRRR